MREKIPAATRMPSVACATLTLLTTSRTVPRTRTASSWITRLATTLASLRFVLPFHFAKFCIIRNCIFGTTSRHQSVALSAIYFVGALGLQILYPDLVIRDAQGNYWGNIMIAKGG